MSDGIFMSVIPMPPSSPPEIRMKVFAIDIGMMHMVLMEL